MIFHLLEQTAKVYSDNIAVCCQHKNVTYKELLFNVKKLAERLSLKGIQKGDNVIIAMDNSIEFIEAFFAINLCGATIVPLYVNMGIHKLLNVVKFYDVKYIITLSKFEKVFSAFQQNDCGILSGIFYLGNSGEVDDCRFIEISSMASEVSQTCPGKEADPAIILFSSGTTQMPKGIMLSNHNIVSNVMAISDYLKLIPEDKILLIKNINHASSITGEMLVSLVNGCTLVLTSNMPTASLILQLIDEYKVTVFFAVPTLLTAILGHRNLEQYNISTLRIINFYGASIAASKIRELADHFVWANLIYSYGLTEAAPRVTYIERDELLKREGSSGVPIKGVSVCILDNKDNVLGPDQSGEIAVKGPNVMLGYYKNEELTRKALKDGLLHTGDIGCLDSDGYLYVTGRKDNLIIRSGKNIYPEEIESVLMGFKGVKEVLVRGEADELAGEDIVAYVVLCEGRKINMRELLMHCKDNLEDYKIPQKIFEVEQLEKTLSGKIVRKQDLKTIM